MLTFLCYLNRSDLGAKQMRFRRYVSVVIIKLHMLCYVDNVFYFS